MHGWRVAFAALAALTLGASPPTAEQRIRTDVEFLASDHLQGRLTGSAGHAIAADYVVRQFQEMGLKPGGPGGSWYLPVPFRRASHAGLPTVRLTIGGRTTTLNAETDVGVEPSLSEAQRSLSAPLVFVGHGISEPLVGIDEYAGLDVRGKMVVALPGSPAGISPDVAAHLETVKAEVAAARGAAGFALLSFGGYNPVPGVSRRALTDWVDVAGGQDKPPSVRFELSLSSQISRRLFQGALESLDQVASHSSRAVKGFDLPARIEIQSRSEWTAFSSPQVVGVHPGADPRLGGEHVILMAHLDHLGVNASARKGEDAIYNGALDNAAGIATMIEAARQFTKSRERPKRSVMFVATTGEEQGLLGSGFFAANPPVPLDRIIGVVNLDMPLLTYDFADITAFGADHSTMARIAAAAAERMNVSVVSDPMPQERLFIRSDHYPFVARGVPAIFLMTGNANGGREAWSRYLSSFYHRTGDDLTQPIRWSAGARFAELNFRIALALAQAPDRPRWYPGDYFGRRLATDASKAGPEPRPRPAGEPAQS